MKDRGGRRGTNHQGRVFLHREVRKGDSHLEGPYHLWNNNPFTKKKGEGGNLRKKRVFERKEN